MSTKNTKGTKKEKVRKLDRRTIMSEGLIYKEESDANDFRVFRVVRGQEVRCLKQARNS